MTNSRLSPFRPSIRLSAAYPANSRPSSRSPDRNAAVPYQPMDPLLSNLSPESTLEALTSTHAVSANEKDSYDILSKSISQVSPAERALGIRAALAAQRLGLWYKEVQKWEWAAQADAQLGKGFVPPPSTADASNSSTLDSSETEYYGSLPSQVVKQYEQRIEEIRDGMESLDVEELKEHVLSAHIPSWSRPSSSNSSVSAPPPLSYVQLSDFTAVITATILRALPYLSRLNNLLSTWDVRLLVLRQIPGLLRSLRITRDELDSSLDALKSPNPPSEQDAVYSRSNFRAKKAELETMVLSVGRRMDRILDGLEGREDSLPENWIDDLEAIESDFGTWVMDAEKRTAENEWKRMIVAEQNNARQHAEVSSESGISEYIEDSNADRPDTTRQNAWSTPMETIDEEPGTIHEPVSNHDENTQLENPTATIEKARLTSSLEEPGATNLPEKSPSDTICDENVAGAQDQGTVQSPESAVLVPSDSEEQRLPARPVSDNQDEEKHSSNWQGGALPALDGPHDEKQTPLPSGEEGACKSLPAPADDGLEQALPSPRVDADSTNISSEDSEKGQPDSNQQPISVGDTPHGSPRPVEPSITARPDHTPSQGKDRLQDLKLNDRGLSHDTPVIYAPDEESIAVASVTAEAATPQRPGSSVIISNGQPRSSRSVSASTGSPGLPPPSNFDAHENRPSNLNKEKDGLPPVKHVLESPIKLSKTRQRQSSPSKNKKQPRRRRPSTTSAGSPTSDYPSLVSSPDFREARPASSNGTLLRTPPQFQLEYPPSRVTASHGDHSLREDRLLRLDNLKNSPRTPFTHNRAVSLPLQRFINERLELNDDGQAAADGERSSGRRASVTFANRSRGQRDVSSRSTTPTNYGQRASDQQSGSSRRDGRPRTSTVTTETSNALEHNTHAYSKNSGRRSLHSKPPHPDMVRLRNQPATQPNIGGVRRHKSHTQLLGDGADSSSDKTGSRSSTPVKQFRQPKDHIDEKISSILSTLPTPIHLVSHTDQEQDSSSGSSSLPLQARERFRSASPQIPPHSPAPSITLTPALSRRRRSHSHGPGESSVKVYHLYRGGKSVPTKLFVRTIGEDGSRVMVRVGGGWADLGEYLREFVIHHGRRSITDSPRVEVQGISPSNSPAYSSSNERHIPRPQSVISTRPSSSISVRKKRRTSNVSDAGDLRTTSSGEALNRSFSPLFYLGGANRRLSVSSNTSAGATSSVSEANHRSFTPSTSMSSSTPLGLAGPKPKSRQVSMTPESEAWVEDVLGQARRSSSLNPHKFGVVPIDRDSPSARTPTLSKAKSISDIGSIGMSRRVALRGLGDRRH